jgi:hypothetical protein
MPAEERDATHRTTGLELLTHEMQTALAEAVAARHAGETGIVPAHFALFWSFVG